MILQKRSRKKWINLLTQEDYNTLVTIQKPMKPSTMQGNIERFFNLNRVDSLFYSVERNADRQGYHIHLMFNAYQCNRDRLAFALDTKKDYITYYEPISDKVAVNRYVTKYMRGDQIHYNFYKK
jgi:hypothetical protein